MADGNPDFLPEGGKARRVYLLLRDEIARGAYPVATALPGEQKLAELHDVSRVTVRRALAALVTDGLIEKRSGAGSVVKAMTQSAGIAANMATLIPQIVQMGTGTTARLLSFGYGKPPHMVSEALGTSDRVQTAVRIRMLDAKPFSHLTTYVPEDIAVNYSESDLAETPLFQLLERSGVQVNDASQTVSATLASPDVAEALDLSVGAALLSLNRVVRDAEGRGIEYLSALYRPDMFRLEMDLARVGAEETRHWEPVIGGST